MKHQTSLYGAASLSKPDDGRVDGDVSLHKPGAFVDPTSAMRVPGTRITLSLPDSQSEPDMESPHPMPLSDPSAGFAPPFSSNRSALDQPHDARD
jgi:hypothetical protein